MISFQQIDSSAEIHHMFLHEPESFKEVEPKYLLPVRSNRNDKPSTSDLIQAVNRLDCVSMCEGSDVSCGSQRKNTAEAARNHL